MLCFVVFYVFGGHIQMSSGADPGGGLRGPGTPLTLLKLVIKRWPLPVAVYISCLCPSVTILDPPLVLIWDHWYPCFRFLVTSPLGFKARLGSALFIFYSGECNVHSLRYTCQPLDSHLLTCISRGRSWLGIKQQPAAPKTNALPL